LSVRAWCREHDVAEASFYAWRRELALRDAEPAGPVFVPVQVAEDAPADIGRIEIMLANGRCIRVCGRVDRPALADVLAVMEDRAC